MAVLVGDGDTPRQYRDIDSAIVDRGTALGAYDGLWDEKSREVGDMKTGPLPGWFSIFTNIKVVVLMRGESRGGERYSRIFLASLLRHFP